MPRRSVILQRVYFYWYFYNVFAVWEPTSTSLLESEVSQTSEARECGYDVPLVALAALARRRQAFPNGGGDGVRDRDGHDGRHAPLGVYLHRFSDARAPRPQLELEIQDEQPPATELDMRLEEDMLLLRYLNAHKKIRTSGILFHAFLAMPV